MRRLLLLVVFLVLSFAIQAQCYEGNVKEANTYYNNGEYKEAKRLYETALKCSDVVRYENGKAAREGVRKCNDKLTGVKPVTPSPKPIHQPEEPPMDIVFKTITVGGLSFNMVYVEGGTFKMGCAGDGGEKCGSEEVPAHDVTLSSYYIGETEVTQALWKAVMGKGSDTENKWSEEDGLGDGFPAYYIRYMDALSFIRRLNRMTGMRFRLPTEAEWEYAARGGNRSKGYKYSGGNEAGEVATLWNNADKKCNVVKKRKCNELGLYDMSGNLWEWCSDWFGKYGADAQNNPKGPGSSDKGRVLRGGSHVTNSYYCRVVFRAYLEETDDCSNENGFRLVLEQ